MFRIKKKVLFISIFILLILLNLKVHAKDTSTTETTETTEKQNFIFDDANIFTNKELLDAKIIEFYNKNNIDLYFYTTETATQESFEKTIKQYTESIKNDFILFYIAKNNGNVGIYTSDNLKSIINDANKMLLLKSMETNISLEDYEGAIFCAISNLENIMENINQSEITHETLNLENIEKNKTKNALSVIFMIISSIIIVTLSIYLIISKIKEKRKKGENT